MDRYTFKHDGQEFEVVRYRFTKVGHHEFDHVVAATAEILRLAEREKEQGDEVNRLGRENSGLKVENAALEEENRNYRAQCAAQQQALLRFVHWNEEGLPAYPERREAYFEAKDLLVHPTGQLAVEWFRAEKAELQAERNALVDRLLSALCIGADDAEKDPRSIVDLLVDSVERLMAANRQLGTDLSAAIATGEEQAEKIRGLNAEEPGTPAHRLNVLLGDLLMLFPKGYRPASCRAPEATLVSEIRAAKDRLARLDALLGSEEPPEGLVECLMPTAGFAPVLAARAWRWFREALAGEPAARPAGESDFDDIISEYLIWSLVAFPESTPASVAAHLRKEVNDELTENPESAEELADIVMLCFHSAARQGHDLTAEIAAKLAVLKTRNWKEPDADGVVEHVREPFIDAPPGPSPVEGAGEGGPQG